MNYKVGDVMVEKSIKEMSTDQIEREMDMLQDMIKKHEDLIKQEKDRVKTLKSYLRKLINERWKR